MSVATLEAVFFDMDGLTVHTESTWLEAEIAVTRSYGGVWTPEDQIANVGGPLLRVASHILAVSGREDVTAEQVARELNAEVERLLRAGAVSWMPGAQDLLAELAAAGVPRALVSASHRRLVDAVLEAIGEDNFMTTIAGDEVRQTKPHPDPYLLAAQRLAASPDRCVVLEDSPTGVTAGEAAGCVVVAVPSVAPIEPRPGRTIVRSLVDVDLATLRDVVVRRHSASA